MKLYFRKIEQGEFSGHSGAETLLIANAQEWHSLWGLHTSILASPTAAPDVDFKHEMVLAYFMGDQSSGGFHVRTESVDLDSRLPPLPILKLSVRICTFEGEPVADVISNPYDIVCVPKMEVGGIIVEVL